MISTIATAAAKGRQEKTTAVPQIHSPPIQSSRQRTAVAGTVGGI